MRCPFRSYQRSVPSLSTVTMCLMAVVLPSKPLFSSCAFCDAALGLRDGQRAVYDGNQVAAYRSGLAGTNVYAIYRSYHVWLVAHIGDGAGSGHDDCEFVCVAFP